MKSALDMLKSYKDQPKPKRRRPEPPTRAQAEIPEIAVDLPGDLREWPSFPRYLVAEMVRCGHDEDQAASQVRIAVHNSCTTSFRRGDIRRESP